MDIYEAIADFNEARLQKQLQRSIEMAMRKGSVKYKEGQHLINLSVINGDGRPVDTLQRNSPLKKRSTKAEDDCGYLSVKDISKSIDSGVCLDTRDTEEEDESDCEYDEVASTDEDGQISGSWENRRSVTPRNTARRKVSPVNSQKAIPHQLLNKSYYIKSKSLTRRKKGKDVLQSNQEINEMMSRSVMDTLDGWTDPSDRGHTPVRRTGSKDTLLSTNSNSVLSIGSKESLLNHNRDDGPRSLDIFPMCAPASNSRRTPYKSYRPSPNEECCAINTEAPVAASKGVLLLEVRKGDVLGVSIINYYNTLMYENFVK